MSIDGLLLVVFALGCGLIVARIVQLSFRVSARRDAYRRNHQARRIR